MKFSQAARTVREGSFSATDEEKLALYGLYKVVMEKGGPSGTRPILDFVEKRKWDAWVSAWNTYGSSAKQAYVSLVEEMCAREGSREGR